MKLENIYKTSSAKYKLKHFASTRAHVLALYCVDDDLNNIVDIVSPFSSYISLCPSLCDQHNQNSRRFRTQIWHSISSPCAFRRCCPEVMTIVVNKVNTSQPFHTTLGVDDDHAQSCRAVSDVRICRKADNVTEIWYWSRTPRCRAQRVDAYWFNCSKVHMDVVNTWWPCFQKDEIEEKLLLSIYDFSLT